MIRGVIVSLLFGIALVFSATLTLIVALIARIMPTKKLRIRATEIAHLAPTLWMILNKWIANISSYKRWNIQGTGELDPKSWYLIIANHASWLDIIVLGIVFNRKIPLLKFFMKKELLWSLPVAGFACYLLGYPFMRRHTVQDIKRNPQLRHQDMETTHQACERFREIPTTVMNFVEGTRFTKEKNEKQGQAYRHLLKPRIAGTAIVMNELGDILSGIVNVTIHYDTDNVGLWAFACGKFRKINVRYEVLPVTADLLGNYYEDREYRRRIQAWITELWTRKDNQLEQLNQTT